MTHTNYELSKALKKFLGEDAPEPMDKIGWGIGIYSFPGEADKYDLTMTCEATNISPAYTLEDVLSKPFCEAAMIKYSIANELVMTKTMLDRNIDELANRLCMSYFNGGFPAVEKELARLIGIEDKWK